MVAVPFYVPPGRVGRLCLSIPAPARATICHFEYSHPQGSEGLNVVLTLGFTLRPVHLFIHSLS